jgi:small conductance mechanosensitive channel
MLIVSELRPNYTTALFTSAGVLSLALAFGAQSLIKDFVNGIFIIIENQFRVGDIISVDKLTGTVEAITIRITVLRDIDGSVHHIPNGLITVSTNKTMDYGRINESIIVSDNANVDTLSKIIDDIGAKMAKDPQFSKKLQEPPRYDSVIGLDTNGDLIVRITAKTDPSEQNKVRSEIFKQLKIAAIKHKIKIHT